MTHPITRLFLMGLLCASGALGGMLYDNTTTPTPDTLLYSLGPYSGIGDQIHLTTAGSAATALLELYNAGDAGTFDVLLRFYQVGAPVGASIGGTFSRNGVSSSGGDVIEVNFDLGGIELPQDVIFVASLANAGAGMDLGLDLFEPPTAGSSDNSFLIVDSGGFAQAGTVQENVYFQLTEAVAPEPSTWMLLSAGLAAVLWRRRVAV